MKWEIPLEGNYLQIRLYKKGFLATLEMTEAEILKRKTLEQTKNIILD